MKHDSRRVKGRSIALVTTTLSLIILILIPVVGYYVNSKGLPIGNDLIVFGMIASLTLNIVGNLLDLSATKGLFQRITLNINRRFRSNTNSADDSDEELAPPLTVEYSKHTAKTLMATSNIVIFCSFGLFLFTKDTSAMAVGVGYSIIVMTYVFLTVYRVRRGLFGSTSTEVTELIEFIVKQASQGQPPDGGTVSRPLWHNELLKKSSDNAATRRTPNG